MRLRTVDRAESSLCACYVAGSCRRSAVCFVVPQTKTGVMPIFEVAPGRKVSGSDFVYIGLYSLSNSVDCYTEFISVFMNPVHSRFLSHYPETRKSLCLRTGLLVRRSGSTILGTLVTLQDTRGHSVSENEGTV